jgi:putative peptidoglycan lipid II flippase
VSTPHPIKANDKPDPAITQKPGLGKTFSLVALVGLASKFAGLVRDQVVLTTFGATHGPIADAYNFAAAFTRDVLVLYGGLGGPFHSCAVTILASEKDRDQKETTALMLQLLLWTAIVMGSISALVYLYAEPLVAFFTPDLEQIQANRQAIQHWLGQDIARTFMPDSRLALDETARLVLRHETIQQLRIMTPMIMLAGLVGTGCGISNVFKELFWPSFSPAIASLAIIIAVLGFPQYGGAALATGTLVGGIGQLLVQIPGMMRAHPDRSMLSFSLLTRIRPGTREYLAMLGPAFMGTAIGQLTSYVDMAFASNLAQGSWTVIANANRLIQLPVGVLLTAMLVPILPRFTEQVIESRVDDLKKELRKAVKILWFLSLPIAALLFVLGKPIVQLLFEHRNFSAKDTDLFVTVLYCFTPYMFFYVARDLLVRVFFAHKDFKTPYKIGLMAIFTKLLLNWLLIMQLRLEVAGLAMATTIMTVVNMSWLIFLLRRKIGNLGLTRLVKPTSIMLAATLACGAAAYYPAQIGPWLAPYAIPYQAHGGALALLAKIAPQIASIACGGISGVLAYLFVCKICGLQEFKIIEEKITKTLARRLAK